MMQSSLRLLAAGVIGGLSGAAVAAGWGGVYVYEGSFGHSAGGTPILARYEIHLDDPVGACRIGIDGFQANEEFLCQAQAASDRLMIRFKSHGDGVLTNRHGVALYNRGTPLLELRRIIRGGAEAIETRWLALKSLDGTTPPQGEYFVKQGPRAGR